ncbi:MAG: biopolymer transporter ExbD, partial [Bacteroidota bacterium]
MKFKRSNQKQSQEINTASLPDIIFMLLFFFMVVTVLKKHTVNLEYQLPESETLEKITQKTMITHIYMGKFKSKEGLQEKIQINDAFVSIEEIEKAIKSARLKIEPEKQDK